MESYRRLRLYAAPVVAAFVLFGCVVFAFLCPPEWRWPYGGFLALVAVLCVLVEVYYWQGVINDETPSVSRPLWPLGDAMSPRLRRSFERALNSFREEERREAIQVLSDSGASPIARIECWPEQKCSLLQLAAAEALLHEWLECLKKHPHAPEEVIVAELFPLEEVEPQRDCVKPRVRRLAPSKDPPKARLATKLDEWSDTIKEKMLDIDITPQSSVHEESEGEDVLLGPLDREQFADRFGVKVNEVYAYIAEQVAAPNTDYDLLLVERKIHPLLSTLRWEAIAMALELRQPDGGPVSIDEVRAIAESLEPAESAATSTGPTGDWVSKYRRMRAAGI